MLSIIVSTLQADQSREALLVTIVIDSITVVVIIIITSSSSIITIINIIVSRCHHRELPNQVNQTVGRGDTTSTTGRAPGLVFGRSL